MLVIPIPISTPKHQGCFVSLSSEDPEGSARLSQPFNHVISNLFTSYRPTQGIPKIEKNETHTSKYSTFHSAFCIISFFTITHLQQACHQWTALYLSLSAFLTVAFLSHICLLSLLFCCVVKGTKFLMLVILYSLSGMEQKFWRVNVLVRSPRS